ncbi:MAG TPA: hypothetical protein VNK95_22955 [Caldilineaceae bacterium]|nr:hypothetical protein [Caldilineaceae bacterium]
MGPIEVLYITIGLIVALVGLARGYVKELGSTLIILVAIFILTFFEEQISALMTVLGERLFGLENESSIDLLLSTFYTLVFVVIVFGSYAGRTLAFSGTPAPPPQGTLISLLIGLLNGYLIAGTLWYYQDAYDYPIGQLVTFENNLTETAQTLINYLPPVLFENPVYWIVPVAVLLIIRVRG